jgi:hypothetical protein
MNNNWQGHNQKTLSNSIGTSSKTNTTNNHNSYKLHQTKNSSNVIYDSISEHKVSNQDKKVHLSMKFSVLNTENNRLYSENSNLRKMNDSLLRNIHEMNQGFTTNTSNAFPMMTEIQTKINDFIKLTCQDIFFDLLLEQKLEMFQIISFYQFSFNDMNKEIYKYFSPLEREINGIMDRTKIATPIYNVLKKVYQENYTKISNKIEKDKIDYIKYANKIGNSLGLNGNKDKEMIIDFLKKTASLCLLCFLSEPQIHLGIDEIGLEVKFNSLVHDALDGFVKAGQTSYVLLPAFYKKESKDNMIVKMQVLSENYDFDY